VKTLKVKIAFEIEVDSDNYDEINDAIRTELSELVEDEDPQDHRYVSVVENEEEDEE
jgi:hypothetical protein